MKFPECWADASGSIVKPTILEDNSVSNWFLAAETCNKAASMQLKYFIVNAVNGGDILGEEVEKMRVSVRCLLYDQRTHFVTQGLFDATARGAGHCRRLRDWFNNPTTAASGTYLPRESNEIEVDPVHNLENGQPSGGEMNVVEMNVVCIVLFFLAEGVCADLRFRTGISSSPDRRSMKSL